jgi:ABC-type glutathione transport system ATPase component
MKMNLLEIEGLTYHSRGQSVSLFEGFNITVAPGEKVGVYGGFQSGKTLWFNYWKGIGNHAGVLFENWLQRLWWNGISTSIRILR